LKPGQFLHDADVSEPLTSFTRRVCSMSVYSLFFDYATVISKDNKDLATVCDQHPTLNRHRDIRCIDHTRVIVPHPSEPHDYINANYVDGFREEKKFILTQSPLEETVQSFWAMIYQEKVVEIVALTPLHPKKSFLYIPTKRTMPVTFGPFTIQFCGSQIIRDAYEASILKLKKEKEKERKILHICFFSWQNMGTPTKPTELIYLATDINFNRKLFMEEAERSGWLQGAQYCLHLFHS
uniref:Tyrosine-protein phosphatase domain-containing protein n=1 Tax=Gongylonema pulchrum TaxID=637853 RepID=A0A183DI44_9BILA